MNDHLYAFVRAKNGHQRDGCRTFVLSLQESLDLIKRVIRKTDVENLGWRKSARSSENGKNCVEVAEGAVEDRD